VDIRKAPSDAEHLSVFALKKLGGRKLFGVRMRKGRRRQRNLEYKSWIDPRISDGIQKERERVREAQKRRELSSKHNVSSKSE